MKNISIEGFIPFVGGKSLISKSLEEVDLTLLDLKHLNIQDESTLEGALITQNQARKLPIGWTIKNTPDKEGRYTVTKLRKFKRSAD